MQKLRLTKRVRAQFSPYDPSGVDREGNGITRGIGGRARINLTVSNPPSLTSSATPGVEG